MSAFDESDCCGNGCANCVLDTKPSLEQATECAKINIINNYSNFALQSKTTFNELHEVVVLHFTSSLGSSEKNAFTLNVPSGKHLMMRAPVNEKYGKQRLLRPYSPFWLDKDKLEFKILVNLNPNGPMSKYISSLSTADNVEFRGPIGGEYCAENNLQNLVLISQGVAIASTMPLVKEILENADDMTRIFQFACFSDLRHAYFRKDLQEFNKFWNYAGYIYLSRQICANIECVENKSCILDCPNLARKLLYKENVFPRRLNGTELLESMGKKLKSSTFVISGSRLFQATIVKELGSLYLDIKEENIFLL